MGTPDIYLIGKDSEDYIEYAVALRRKGRRGKFAVDDVLILVEDTHTKIIDTKDNFFFMYLNPTFSRMDAEFVGLFGVNPGAFRSQGENEISTYPAISWRSCPLTPEIAYAMPWSVAIPPGEMVSVHPTNFKLWKFGAGLEGGPYYTKDYLTPITGSGQFRVYSAQVSLTDFAYNWLAFVHQIGSRTDTADNNTVDTKLKLVMYDSTAIVGEVDLVAPPIPLRRYMIYPGLYVRRFNEPDGVKRNFMYQHSASAPGVLMELTDSDLGTEGIDVPLPALPTRTRSGSHYTDSIYDIFTAPQALHYYVVRFDSDIKLDMQGPGYGANVAFYDGTSLKVEKRLKTDWTLVDTYLLTPSAVDTTLMGLPVAAQVANCDGGTAYTGPEERRSRFIPVGVQTDLLAANGVISGMQPQTCGSVIVQNGVEYPFYPVALVTQDRFFGTAERRQAFLDNGDTTSITFGTLSQPVMLWLGAPVEFGGWRWSGVDAAGLDLPTGDKISASATWLREPLCDGNVMLHQLSPQTPRDIFLYWVQTNPDNVDGVRYATQPAYILCDNAVPALEGDVFQVDLGIDLNGAPGVSETFTYTCAGGETSGDVIDALISSINGSSIYSAVSSAAPSGFTGVCLKVSVPATGRLTVSCQPMRPSLHHNRMQRVIKIAVQNEIPVVSLAREFHETYTPFWYEF